MATVVNTKTDNYDVRIDRSSIWGNPFEVGRDGTREEVIEKYRELIISSPRMVSLAKKLLPGKRLGCWCKPAPCHGDVLVELVNGS